MDEHENQAANHEQCFEKTFCTIQNSPITETLDFRHEFNILQIESKI